MGDIFIMEDGTAKTTRPDGKCWSQSKIKEQGGEHMKTVGTCGTFSSCDKSRASFVFDTSGYHSCVKGSCVCQEGWQPDPDGKESCLPNPGTCWPDSIEQTQEFPCKAPRKESGSNKDGHKICFTALGWDAQRKNWGAERCMRDLLDVEWDDMNDDEKLLVGKWKKWPGEVELRHSNSP